MPATATTEYTPYAFSTFLQREVSYRTYVAASRFSQVSRPMGNFRQCRPRGTWITTGRPNATFDYCNYHRSSRNTRLYGSTVRWDQGKTKFGRNLAKKIAKFRDGEITAADLMHYIYRADRVAWGMWASIFTNSVIAEAYCAQSEYAQCGCSGRLEHHDNGEVVYGFGWVSRRSLCANFWMCSGCQEYHHTNASRYAVGESQYCEACFENSDCHECMHCGSFYHRSDLRQVRNQRHISYLCLDCIEASPDDWEEVDSEYCQRITGLIAEYNVTETGPLGRLPLNRSRSHVLACELEMEVNCRTSFAKELRSVRSRNDCHCKRDGSLSSTYGVEVVTGYGPRKALGKVLADIVKVANKYGGQSHNGEHCGLHVCLDRSDLTDRQIARVIVFWNQRDNYPFLRVFTRRDYWRNSYCLGKEHKGTPRFLADSAVDSNADKYEVVNVLHNTHLEFRAFRGTLVLGTLMACLALVSLVVSYCRQSRKHTELTASDFCRWVRDKVKADDSRRVNLVKYLANKRSSLDSFIKAN